MTNRTGEIITTHVVVPVGESVSITGCTFTEGVQVRMHESSQAIITDCNFRRRGNRPCIVVGHHGSIVTGCNTYTKGTK